MPDTLPGRQRRVRQAAGWHSCLLPAPLRERWLLQLGQAPAWAGHMAALRLCRGWEAKDRWGGGVVLSSSKKVTYPSVGLEFSHLGKERSNQFHVASDGAGALVPGEQRAGSSG